MGNVKKDFSHVLNPNETARAVKEYYSSICSSCGKSCCTYNNSPISALFPLPTTLESEVVTTLKKGILLNRDFKNRFRENVRQSLKNHEEQGMGENLLESVVTNDYSIQSVVEAFRRVDEAITKHNKKVYSEDPGNDGKRVVNTCFFLIPGKGCILEEYKSYTCITAFRKCFRELNLKDYVEANIHKANSGDVIDFLTQDNEISSRYIIPKLIIGASKETRDRISRIFYRKPLPELGELSYYQLAKLADFITFPFINPPGSIKNLIDRNSFYVLDTVKDPPPVVFISGIYPGEMDDSFDFGLEYVQVFSLVNTGMAK